MAIRPGERSAERGAPDPLLPGMALGVTPLGRTPVPSYGSARYSAFSAAVVARASDPRYPFGSFGLRITTERQ